MKNPTDTSTTDKKRDKPAAIVLFLVCWISYGYFFHGANWGTNASMDLTRAIVAKGEFFIDEYTFNTGDLSEYNGHFYAAKNPGASFFAVPAHFLIHIFSPNAFDSFLGSQYAVHATTLFSFSLFSALAVALFFLWLRRFANYYPALGAAVVFSLGSMFFEYSSSISAQGLVAGLYAVACYLIWKTGDGNERGQVGFAAVFATGLVLGFAVFSDPIAIFSVPLFMVVIAVKKTKLAQWAAFFAGALIPAVLLAVYNFYSFDSIFTTAYLYQDSMFNHQDAFLGVLGAPSLTTLYYITLHPFRGLFWSSPVMVLSLFGLLWLFKQRETRLVAFLCSGVMIIYVTFNISYMNWNGGMSVGPRHLIASLPFFSASLVMIFSGPIILRVLAIFLAGLSILVHLAVCLVNPFVPISKQTLNPYTEHIVSVLLKNTVSTNNISYLPTSPRHYLSQETWLEKWASYNVGELLGLEGLLSALPLLFVWGLAAVALVALNRTKTTAGAESKPRKKISPWRIMVWVSILLVMILAVWVFGFTRDAQTDKDGDGRTDEWLQVNLKRQKVEFRKDKNRDGTVDYIEKYDDGVLVKMMADFDYNGTFEIVSHYDPETRKLTLLERDTNDDGKPDRKTLYEKGTGRPLTIVLDRDFDGQYDEEYDKGVK